MDSTAARPALGHGRPAAGGPRAGSPGRARHRITRWSASTQDHCVAGRSGGCPPEGGCRGPLPRRARRDRMIGLTRTTGERCCLDPAQIERVEAHPSAQRETTVFLTDGAKYVVLETPKQVIGKVREYRAAVMVNAWRLIDTPDHRAEVTGAAVVPFPTRPKP